MFIFKILLIILVAAPVIGISLVFYSQMMAYIREKNKREKAEIERERFEKAARRRSEAEAPKEDKADAKAERKEKRGRKSGTGRKRKTDRSEDQK